MKTTSQRHATCRLLTQLPYGIIVAMSLAWALDTAGALNCLYQAAPPMRFDFVSLGAFSLIGAVFSQKAWRIMQHQISLKMICLVGLIGAIAAILVSFSGESMDTNSPIQLALAIIALVTMSAFQAYVLLFAFRSLSCMSMIQAMLSIVFWLACTGLFMLVLFAAESLPLRQCACAATPILVFLLIKNDWKKWTPQNVESSRLRPDEASPQRTRGIPWNLLVVQFAMLIAIKALSLFIEFNFTSITGAGFVITALVIIAYFVGFRNAKRASCS